MDKKKVKELIEELRSIIYETKGKDSEDEANLTIALAAIQKIDIEFSKPDWVSVEDGLPEYGEEVLVTSKENPNGIWLSYKAIQRRRVFLSNTR